jgi:rhamnulokinase
MPARIREACARTGQRSPDDRATLVRAIFESLACKYRQILDEIEEVTGRPLDTVHIIGGGARNEVLCRLTADVSRRVVVAGPVEAAALGNVLVQMHAFGDVGSLTEMREIVRDSTDLVTYEPDAAEGRWNDLYERFRAISAREVVVG